MSFNSRQVWEHLVQDFLEIKCTLREPEQEFLLNFLKDKGVRADMIRMHPAFSIDGHLIIIVEGKNTKKRHELTRLL